MPSAVLNKPESSSIPELAKQFIDSLQSNDDRFFYIYGDALVEPVTDPMSNTGRLRPIALPDLKWYLRRFFSSESEKTIATIAEDILHDPELPLPRIRGLVTTPTFRQDLSLITVPGFDEASGLYYSPDPTLADFSFRTDADERTALNGRNLIFELLTDFPFRHPNERYVYLASLLTLFLQSSMRAIVPALGVDGNGQSVGKGLLSSMLDWIPFGNDTAMASAPKGREEWSSKVDSILLSGTQFQIIDNIVGKFSSDELASVLTSMRRNVRIKGYSKMANVPVSIFWVLNGNDMRLDSDLAQRVIMCHLEHPEPGSRQQEKFFIQKTYGCSIEVLVKKERARYIQACLDMICAWVNAGAPRRQKLVMAKYGEWEAIIGGIIDRLEPDAKFLGDYLTSAESVDTEKEETITFLRALVREFPGCNSNPIGVAEIIDRIFPSEGRSAIRDLLPDGLLLQDQKSSLAKRLGRWLKQASTRRWDQIEMIPNKDTHSDVWKYCIGEGIKSGVKVKAKTSVGGLFDDDD